ncbi:MAG: helix-turn-helix domain-containing protein, partial [Pseudomonadota bacterium]
MPEIVHEHQADGTRQHFHLTTDGEHDVQTKVSRRDLKGEMIAAWVMDGWLADMHAAAWLLLTYLAARAQPTGEGRLTLVMPSERDIEQQTGLPRSSVYRHRRQLVALGLVRRSSIRSEARWHLYRSPERCEQDACDAQHCLEFPAESESGSHDLHAAQTREQEEGAPHEWRATGETKEGAPHGWRATGETEEGAP